MTDPATIDLYCQVVVIIAECGAEVFKSAVTIFACAFALKQMYSKFKKK